jgi:hypothetical protein
MRAPVIAASLLLAPAPAYAAEKHTIDSVAGDTVVLDDGSSFRAQDDISSWQDGDTVIVNTARDRLSNKDQNETVDADEE